MRRALPPLKTLAAFAAALVGWGAHAYTLRGAVIDDSYISLRYAWHLVHGHGLVYNPGQRVEGFTNFSWTLLGAAMLRLGVDPLRALLVASTLAGLVTMVTVLRAGRALGRPDETSGVWGAAVLAAAAGMAMYPHAGMETLLDTMLVTLAAVALVQRRPTHFAAWTSLAFMTRPEAGLLGVLGLALMAPRPRDALRALPVFALLVLPYLGWKLWYFHALLPNTLSAKRPDVAHGFRYLAEFARPLAVVILAAVAGAWRSRPRAELLALWLVHALAAALEGGDWMPAHRLLLPTLPWLCVAADGALGDALRGLVGRGSLRATWWRRLAGVAVLVGFGVWVTTSVRTTRMLRSWYTELARVDRYRADLARHLSRHGVRSVALFDIGLFAYVDPSMDVLDLGGLTDRVIARSPGPLGDKLFPVSHLEARDPEVTVLTSFHPMTRTASGSLEIDTIWSVERRVVTSPWFIRRVGYLCSVQVPSGYAMHVFARTDLPQRDALVGGPCEALP